MIYSGSWFDSYITGEYFEFTGYTTGASGENAYAHLRPRSVSYLGNRHDGDFIDIYIQTSETGNLSNNSALKTWEYRGRGMGLLLKQEHLSETGKIKFYMNGVAARAGSGVSNWEVEDGNEYDYFVSEKDYSVGDGGEIYQELDFSTNAQMENLHGIYDIIEEEEKGVFRITGGAEPFVTGNWERVDNERYVLSSNGEVEILSIAALQGEEMWSIWIMNISGTLAYYTFNKTGYPWECDGWVQLAGSNPAPEFEYLGKQDVSITGLGMYSWGVFPEISTTNRDVFFNGVKIYEGGQYASSGEYFVPSGEITGLTGTYFSFPRLSGQQFYTGNSVYDVYRADTFRNGSAMFWINGIRKDIREYVHHDIYADLITGVEIFDDDLSNVSEGSI